MYTSSVIARGKAAIQGSETEQRIAVLLYDDAVQVISSFELNQLASLTYHEAQVITSATDMTEIMLDHLEQIMKSPVSYSTITVQKSLVVAKHIMVHGAEKCVPLIRMQLGRYVELLTQYNTVLLAQQQSGAWLLRIKGGSVDHGGPVREVAVAVHNLLLSPQALAYERSISADPHSLVPVGSKVQVAFATDEVRFQHLKKQMEEQQKIILKSNLKKASDGFGSGYMAADGKTVVGAAHGIEEMLAMQQREEQKFRDEQQAAQQRKKSSFSEYEAPSFTQAQVHNCNKQQQQQQYYHQDQYQQPTAPAPAPEVDLLDLGNETTSAPSITPAASQEEDLLFGGITAASDSKPEFTYGAALDYSLQATVVPFGPVSTFHNQNADVSGLLGTMSLGQSVPAMQPQRPIMSSNDDHFAALDALALGANPLSTLSSRNAVAVTGRSNGISLNSETGMPPNRSALSQNIGNGMPVVSSAYSGLDGLLGTPAVSKDAFSSLGAAFAAPAPTPSLNALNDLSRFTTSESFPQHQGHGFALPPTRDQPPPDFAISPNLSSILVSDMSFASPPMVDNDSENGFFMGGTIGAGLAPAPAVPPPPPPGGW